MLYDPRRHESLIATPWNEDRARESIARIAADAEQSFSADGLWPIHPVDRSPERPPDSIKPLYHGAAGVVWALTYLNETGAISLRRDYLPAVPGLIQRNRDDLRKHDSVREYMGRELASYLVGETGILLLQWKLAPSEDLAQQLHAALESKIGDPRGLAWGAAGAMLTALFMNERTGEFTLAGSISPALRCALGTVAV